MNNSMFYRGVLAGLTKTADVPPKKKSIFHNPAFWGGLGATGLGAYGLYKYMKPDTSQPVTPPPAPKPEWNPANIKDEVSESDPNMFDKLNNAASLTTVGGLGLGGSAKGVNYALGKMTPDLRLLKYLPYVKNIGFRTGSFAGGGLYNIFDALNPNNRIDKLSRGAELAGGVGEAGLGVQSMLTPLAGRAAMLAGVPVTAAFGVGVGGQMALQHGTNAMIDNSKGIRQLSHEIPDLLRMLKNKNDPNYEWAINRSRDWFETKNGNEVLNSVTNPGYWARLGYNPTLTFRPGNDGNTEVAPLSNALNRLRAVYNNEMKTHAPIPPEPVMQDAPTNYSTLQSVM